MKRKNIVIFAVVAAVFFVQVWYGLAPPPPPAPGEIPGGGANAPGAVVFSALLAGFLVWALLEALFWAYAKIKENFKSN